MRKKISCSECPKPCCDDIKLVRTEGNINGPEPGDLPVGSWIYESGIWLVKKANGKWVCRAFSVENGLCTIYKYRPLLCRWFRCDAARKQKPSRMPANNYSVQNSQYTLHLMVPNPKYKN